MRLNSIILESSADRELEAAIKTGYGWITPDGDILNVHGGPFNHWFIIDKLKRYRKYRKLTKFIEDSDAMLEALQKTAQDQQTQDEIAREQGQEIKAARYRQEWVGSSNYEQWANALKHEQERFESGKKLDGSNIMNLSYEWKHVVEEMIYDEGFIRFATGQDVVGFEGISDSIRKNSDIVMFLHESIEANRGQDMTIEVYERDTERLTSGPSYKRRSPSEQWQAPANSSDFGSQFKE